MLTKLLSHLNLSHLQYKFKSDATGWTIKNSSSWLAKLNHSKINKQLKKKDQKYEAIFKDIEQSFSGFFGSPVKLNAGKRKGKIIIEYSSNEDLERLLDLIK